MKVSARSRRGKRGKEKKMSAVVEKENFAINLTDQCKTHDQWLTVVKFGMGTLLKDQHLLFEIIVREAEREAKRSGVDSHVAADHVASIMKELGLRLICADTFNRND